MRRLNTIPRQDAVPAAMAAGLVVFHLLFLLRQACAVLPFPYPVDYREGVTSFWTLMVHRHLCLYPPVDAGALIAHNPYTPLIPSLASAVMYAASDPVFLAGRIVSLASLAAAAACVFAMTRKASALFAMGAVALFLFSPLAARAGMRAHVDMAGACFSLAGVLAMEKRRPALSGFFCACAFLTKPLYLWAGLACLIASTRGRGRTSPVFAAACLSTVAAGIAAGGMPDLCFPEMFRHLVAMNILLFAPRHFFSVLACVSGTHALLLAATLWFLLRHPDRRRALWWYCLVLLPASVCSAKTGAEDNYYLELVASGAVCLGLSAQERLPDGRRVFLLLVSVQMLLYLPVAPAPTFTRTYGQEIPAAATSSLPGRAQEEEGQLLAEALSAGSGPVLAEDIGFLLAAGRDVYLEDPYQFSQLARFGRWDQTPLLERVKSGFFSLIVLGQESYEKGSSPYFTEQVVAAVRERYVESRVIGRYRLLVRRE